MELDDEVVHALRSAECTGNLLRIRARLDRPLYVRTNKVLEAAGGRWSRREQAHVFEEDAAVVVARLLDDGRVTTSAENGYFPTPAPVIDVLVARAELAPGMTVLEPSAGRGAIAARLHALGCVVDCVELDPMNVAALGRLGCARSVLWGDFLSIPPRPVYDRVVMNPPFAKKADIAHVRHALGFLVPEGLLVAVMSQGAAFRSDRATRALREAIDRVGGCLLDLPDESFRESGTLVRTVVAVIPGSGAALGDPTLEATSQ